MHRNWTALALGALFALGTCWVLFNDVRSPAQVTIDHVMTLLVLLGTVAAGHSFGPQLRQLHLLRALGLAVLFVAGTGYCVTQSASRNAEVAVAKTQGIAATNATRQRIERDLAEASESLRRAKMVELVECRTGMGPRCRAATQLATQAKADHRTLEDRLTYARPEQVADAGTKHAAVVFASLPWVSASAASIERTLLLTTPFLKALFLEVATLVFFGIGLSHGSRKAEPKVSQHETQGIATGLPALASPLQPVRQEIVRLVALPPPAPTEHPVVIALRQAGQPLSNDELAFAMGCSAGEASKRTREISDQLIVGKAGKKLAITLRECL